LTLVSNPTFNIHGDLGFRKGNVLYIPFSASVPLAKELFDSVIKGSRKDFNREINKIAGWNAGQLRVKIDVSKSYFQPSGAADPFKGYYCFPVIG